MISKKEIEFGCALEKILDKVSRELVDVDEYISAIEDIKDICEEILKDIIDD